MRIFLLLFLLSNIVSYGQPLSGTWHMQAETDTIVPLFMDIPIALNRGEPVGNGCFFVMRIEENSDTLYLSSTGYCQDSRCGWSYDHRFRIVASRKRNNLIGTIQWFDERWQSQSFQDIRIRYRLDQGILKIRRVQIE